MDKDEMDKDEYDLAKIEAATIRERLPVRGEGAWMKYAGFVETGDPHSSQAIDDLIYGTKD
jgi:hypothetical protein